MSATTGGAATGGAAPSGGGPAAGAPQPPPPPPPPARGSLIQAGWVWANQAQDMGMIASRALLIIIAVIALFALSGGLGVLFMGIVPGNQSSEAALAIPIMLRGGEILLTLAAALLVFLVILSREGDAILTLLGVLVIAAIIIPMQDLMKMAAFVGRPDHEYVEQSASAGRSGFVSRNVSDASAERALHHLRTNPDTRDIFAALNIRDTTKFSTELSRVLYRMDIEMLEAAVRTRALDRQLRDSLDESRMRQIGMMPNLVRQLRADYMALRDMGLVSMPPGELHNVIVTTLGVEVLCRITPLDPRVATEAVNRRLNRPSAAEPRCEPQTARGLDEAQIAAVAAPAPGVAAPAATVPLRSYAFDFARVNTPEGQTQPDMAVPAGGAAVIDFEVPAGQSFDALIVTANARLGLDPFLTLIGPDNTVLAEDDDSGGSLNAQIVRSLAPGRHRVRLTDFASGSGSASVTIRPAQVAERLAALPIRGATLDAGLIALADAPEFCDAVLTATGGQVVELQNTNRLMRCRIPATGTWTFEARAIGRGDLEMALYRINPETNAASFLAFDDDSAGSLNPRITQRVEEGLVLLRLRQRGDPRQASLQLTIRQAP
jgi:hypothetical protein